MSNSSHTLNQLSKVLSRIDNACLAANRNPASVRLVGASKKQSAELIGRFAAQGLTDVGENYLREAIDKQDQLTEVSLNWHFIGQIQSNKTKLIAENFAWVHGVDRMKIARRLGVQNPHPRPINVLLQINLDDESSKGGVPPSEATELCAHMSELAGIELCGFTVIPKPRESRDEQRAVFARTRELLSRANQQHGLAMNQLSMGMSNDLEAAISEGSTMVRVGTDLFGARS